jgi:undecaprenyl-diphosphatase
MAIGPDTVTLPSRGYRIDPRKALGVAALGWAGFAVIAWAVHSGHTAAIDKAGILFWRGSDLQPSGSPAVLEDVRDVTALGGVLLRNFFALMAVVALLFLKLRREATLLVLTVMVGWIVNSGLKHLVGRARPEIVPHLMEASGNSFPSGHSFNSAVVYLSIALAFAAISPRESVRLTIVATALVVSLLIAWTRVWLGVHWPSDVTAGWLGGVAWAFTASALLYRPAKAAADTVSAATDTPARPTVH